jgi:corrinoid protein of di/trimethylamine methyltransferase
MKEALFGELRTALENFDVETAKRVAQKVIDTNISAIDAIELGLLPGLRIIGNKFSSGEYFLPELMLGAKVFKEAAAILEQKMPLGERPTKGTIVLGTVKNDVHDIGKNLVGTMLSMAGIRVVDIGVDCSTEKFIDKALEVNAQVIGASALLTITMEKQREIIEVLRRRDLKKRFKVVVGGAAVDETWAKEIGADGYAENAQEAVTLVSSLLGR